MWRAQVSHPFEAISTHSANVQNMLSISDICSLAFARPAETMKASAMCSLQQQFKQLEQSLTDRLDQHAQANMQQFALMLQAITADKADSKDSMITTYVQHRHQRARLTDDIIPVLARNEVLDTVFSFVGIGDYYYVAGVCRNWRGRYLTFCHKTPERWTGAMRPPYTSCSNIVATAARLQLALDNGLPIELLDTANWNVVVSLTTRPSEPTEVLTLARLYGLQWNNLLTQCAAQCKQYELLRWLRKCGCSWDLVVILDEIVDTSDDLDHLKQLRAITGPWPAEHLATMLCYAGRHDDADALDTAKWLREQGAAWPKSFYDSHQDAGRSSCWCAINVHWALTNGSTWLMWRCKIWHQSATMCVILMLLRAVKKYAITSTVMAAIQKNCLRGHTRMAALVHVAK
jgi:hypothetical protein